MPEINIQVSVDFSGVTIPAPQTAWTAPMPKCTVTPAGVLEVTGPSQVTWALSSPNVPPGYTLVFGTEDKERVEPIAFARSPNVNTIVWTGDRPTRVDDTHVTLVDTDTQPGTFEYTVWYLLVRNSDQARTFPVLQDPDIQNTGG